VPLSESVTKNAYERVEKVHYYQLLTLDSWDRLLVKQTSYRSPIGSLFHFVCGPIV